MKRKNKKLILLLAAALLLTILLPGCKKEDLSLQKEAVWGQWEYCLKVHEVVYDTVLWALDEAQPFSEQFTWDTLLRARTAASGAKLLLEKLELLGHEVEEADYLLLLRAGLEPEAVLTEYENLWGMLRQNLITVSCLEEMLMTDVWLYPNAQALGDWLDNCRSRLELKCRYLCQTTNYLLLLWEAPEKWMSLTENYPTVASGAEEWCHDGDLLQISCAQTLDSLSALQTGDSKYYGIAAYTSNLLRETDARSRRGLYDYQKLRGYLQTIPGASAYFPLPLELPDERQIVYCVPDAASGGYRLLERGEEPEAQSLMCMISCAGVERDLAEDYALLLESLGLGVHTELDEAGNEFVILCRSGSSELTARWQDGNMDIYLPSADSCTVPDWYLLALASA